MSEKYDHKKIEGRWQAIWNSSGIYRTPEDPAKPKCYVLDMFPYPSGEGLHVGHPRGYIATDVYARMKRMRGFNVLHPMGWDAFGLPAEQFAIKNKVHPRVAVDKNVARYKEQLSAIGFNYDWEREVNTTDPAFYRWTQWIFLKMFEKGLAYESYEPINWCPKCQTGLANEDLEDGKCERCDTPVEKKPMRQWVLRITNYADRMLADIDKLEWPTSIKESQKNWIGRSEGAEIAFPIVSKSRKALLIHGFDGSPTYGWKPWLKSSLEMAGFEVRSPQLPNTKHPDFDETMTFLEKEIADLDENDILVGHSLGAHFALKLAEQKEFAKIVIVAPTVGGFDYPYDDWKINDPGDDYDSCQRVLDDHPVNFSKIQTKKKIAIFGTNDRGIPLKHADRLGNDWKVIKLDGVHHMSHQESVLEILEATTSSIKVFTTRPDTLFGVTYLVLAPENQILDELKDLITNWSEVEKYRDETKARTTIERTAEGREKTGVSLDGVYAINPANGEEVPVYIADYVLAEYGTGAVMAVPAHDERDFEFAKKYHLPMIMVVCPHAPHPSCPILDDAYTGEGKLVMSGNFNGLTNEDAKKKITDFVKGRWVTKYRLKDWVFSRQRYWGEPIPVVHCEKDGVVAVPEKDLPVVLPQVESYEPTGTGESPLANIAEWVNTTCPKCGGPAKRETNTMPQWAGSSWYYLRYIDPHNSTALVDQGKERYWSPVDMYVGGAEHATRHLIYARFYHKFLYDLGVVHHDEPFMRLQNVGLIMANDGRKMSKRWGNVVNPDDVVAEYGADTLRLYEMFVGPFGQSVAWSVQSILGPRRFLERVWRLQENVSDTTPNTLEALIHKTIKKVSDDVEYFNFNTAISSLMILLNEMEKESTIARSAYETLLVLLAPFAPHITEELWHILGNKESMHFASWPSYDPAKCVASEVTIAVQVNGKLRDTIVVAHDIEKNELERAVRTLPAVIKWTEGKEIKNIVIVPGRLVNVVIG